MERNRPGSSKTTKSSNADFHLAHERPALLLSPWQRLPVATSSGRRPKAAHP